MPGGSLMFIIRKWSFIITNVDNDKKGRRSTIVLEAKGKKVTIITLYQLPDKSAEGIYTVKA